MNRRKSVVLSAAVISAALLAGGCGGGSSSTAASQGTGQAGGGSSNSTMPVASPISSPGADLQVTLDQLLGEHALLAIQATQKGFDGSPDFGQVAAQLDANSVALSKAIGSIYGAKAGDQFLNGKNMWRAHIKDFVNYTVALKTHDKAGMAKAVASLGLYVKQFGSFLAGATGLPVNAVQADLLAHVGQLKGQIDAYATGNYTKSAMYTDMAYTHMFMTGQILAQGIVNQSPTKFVH